MSKKIYFGSNLKMYKTVQETTDYLQELAKETEEIRAKHPEVQLFILPSFTALDAAKGCVDEQVIRIGAQNMYWEEEGQFTGEVSPRMLEQIGVDLVMAGHSERRHVFGENDYEENKKMLKAIEHGFTGLLCIGETAEEKEFGISDEVLRTQIKVGLHGLDASQVSNIWVAYEPVWSIGVNGTPATTDYAEEKHEVIKQTLRELFGEAADEIPVLYGGSVNPTNAVPMMQQPSIDGLYVGRSAWNAKAFKELMEDVLNTCFA